MKTAQQNSSTNFLDKATLVKLKLKALRPGVWFRALPRIDRVLADLTIQVADTIRSPHIAQSILSIAGKLEGLLESRLRRAVREIGFPIAHKFSFLRRNGATKQLKNGEPTKVCPILDSSENIQQVLTPYMVNIVDLVFIAVFTVIYAWAFYNILIIAAGVRNVRKTSKSLNSATLRKIATCPLSPLSSPRRPRVGMKTEKTGATNNLAFAVETEQVY